MSTINEGTVIQLVRDINEIRYWTQLFDPVEFMGLVAECRDPCEEPMLRRRYSSQRGHGMAPATL